MSLKTLKASAAMILSTVLLQACVVAPTVGDVQSDKPPKIIVDPQDEKSRMWDRPGAFGPVPANEAARGEAVCGSLNRDGVEFKATGFHAKALDINGNPFPGGGFFCVRK